MSCQLLIYVIFFCGNCEVGATTIVVVRTPDEIAIAADSQGTFQGNNLPINRRTVCKVYQGADGVFFAVAGLVNDPSTGFNVPELVTRESRIGKTMSEKLRRVEDALKAALLAEIPHIKDRDPDGYRRLVGDKGAITVMFAGVEARSPIATGVSVGLAFSPEGSISIDVMRDSCPGNCPNGTKIFWLGEADIIEHTIADRRIPSLGPSDLAKFLVQLEIDSGLPGVGGPIDLLRILPGGTQWIQQKPGCPIIPISPEK
jgi:hypothetical protein